jgi:ligand-binding sensor domain-containing protein/signal transduction histidine kinase
MSKTLLVILLTLSVLVASAQQRSGSLLNHYKGKEIQFDLVKPPKEESWNSVIRAIAQDRLGFLWIGTGNGLYRYDGSKSVAFHHEPNNSNSIAKNLGVNCIYVNNQDFLLLGTFGGGMDRYDLSTGKFTHYRYSAKDPSSLSSDTVMAIVKDREGLFWVGTHNGLNLFDSKTGKFIRYKNNPSDPSSLSDNRVHVLIKDRAGTLWIGTKSTWPHYGGSRVGGLNRYDARRGKFIRYMHKPDDPTSLIDNHVTALFEDRRGAFWVGTAGDGLHTMDREKGTFVRHRYSAAHPEGLSRPPVVEGDTSLVRDHITFITEDAKGNLWIGTFGNGINVYDPVAKKTAHYKAEQSGKNGLKDVRFGTAFAAKEGIFWVGGRSENLYKIYAGKTVLTRYSIDKNVTSFLEDQEEVLWITTSQGLLRKSKDGNRQQFLVDKEPLSHKYRMNVVVEDDRHYLWIGTRFGLYHFNPVTQTFATYHHETGNQASLLCDTILALTMGRDNKLWIGTLRGLDVLDLITGTFKHYVPNPEDSTSLGGIADKGVPMVTNILVTRSNTVWVCVGGGINRLNEQTGHFKQYTTGGGVVHMMEDSGGTLWAGTFAGLYRYDKNSDNFQPFTDPLKIINRNSIVYNITEDHQKDLWLKTPKGFIKLNIKKGEASAYENNGQSYSWSLSRSYVTRSGKILSGDTSGYFEFHPDELSRATPPNVVITGFAISDNPVLPGKSSVLAQPVYETNDIRLKYNQNSFGFTFSNIDFTGSGEDKHMLCMLENYEIKWHKANEGTADYYNIPPGKYLFRVKAVGSNGVWVEKSIAVIVAPPWWRTWWAYCIYGLLLIAGVYGMHRFQRQRLIRREQEKARAKELAQAKEIEKAYSELKATQAQLVQREKMASLGELTAGIAHEIQNPLNFVNNFSEVNTELIAELREEAKAGNTEEVLVIASDLDENLQKISHHGKRADAIVKGMLQHSRKTTDKKESTDINALADEYLRLSYHGLRAKDKDFNADFKTKFDESIDKIEVVPQDIGRVLLNLYNNAFYSVNEKKKAPALKGENYEPIVWVTTKRISSPPSGGAGGLEISVRDNGTGIPRKVLDKIYQPFFTTKPTGQGTGLGLSLSYDIVKAHGGELKVESKEGEGSQFTIQL